MLIFGFFSYALALDAPKNIVLDNAWEDKLEISWDSLEWAELYTVSYWKESILAWPYEHELEIIVDKEAKTIIEGLNSDTKYYISVKSYDSLENESEYSQEVSFTTLWDLEELKINDIDVLSTKELEISFNMDLKVDPNSASVKIVNLDDDLDDIEVLKYEFNSNVLKLYLVNELDDLQNYSSTIISLEWENWEKITSWVDWVINFEVPEVFEEQVDIEEVIVWLNSAFEVGDENKEEWSLDTSLFTKILGWKNINNTDEKAIESVAKEKKDLPTTGPSEIFLFLLLSFIIWALLIIFRRKSIS